MPRDSVDAQCSHVKVHVDGDTRWRLGARRDGHPACCGRGGEGHREVFPARRLLGAPLLGERAHHRRKGMPAASEQSHWPHRSGLVYVRSLFVERVRSSLNGSYTSTFHIPRVFERPAPGGGIIPCPAAPPCGVCRVAAPPWRSQSAQRQTARRHWARALPRGGPCELSEGI